ncbi:MAG: ABC transporter permease [Anaerolineae bacterium]|nr:ABC transporter permease [Anaerolineae bacterium]
MSSVSEIDLTLDDPSAGSILDYRSNSLWRLTLRRLRRQRSAVFGATILGLLIFAAIAAPLIAPYGPQERLSGVEKRSGPCIHLLGCPEEQAQHILGIDGNFRDVFTRILYGARVSLRVGFVTVSFAITVGTFLGSVSGYFGGWVDQVIMRILDVVLAFPFLLLAIAIVSMLGAGLTNAMLAIAVVTIPQYARVVRASVLSVREMDFVEASRALGASHSRILFGRILPNALPPLIVQATLGIGTAILDTAALSFIGLGAQPPTPEWGYMLSSERNQVFSAPHLVFFPGFAIMLTVLAFNLLGDGLRDALDPRLAHAGFRR